MKKNTFVTDLSTIEEVISGKLFKIPDYQRGYSWEKDQVEDLIKDIEHVQNQDFMHYTGTLVISKSDKSDRFDIVDGQQRLTTIFILLKEIYKTDPERYADLREKFLIRKNGDHVLETNRETAAFFRQAIIGDNTNLKEDIKSLKNLKRTKTIISEQLKKNPEKVEIIKETVLTKLGFLCFSPNNTKEIGIMFEVINNRGKELSELEKIKNYFIYYATIHNNKTLKDKVNDNWGVILKYLSKADVLSNQDENNYLRNCYIVFYDNNKSKSWYSYNELKTKYPPDSEENLEDKIEEISKFVDFLQMASQAYAYFFNGEVFNEEYEDEYKNEIAYHIRQLRCHPVNASIFPLYLATMSYLRRFPERVEKLLNYIEITNFRTYVLPNPSVSRADSKQGDLFLWANELFNLPDWDSEEEDKEYYSELDRILEGDIFDATLISLEDFTKSMCPETIFIQSLTIDNNEAINYYHWNGLRYFLAAYEEYRNKNRRETWNIEKILIGRKETKKEKLNDYLSKEHIWASKNNIKYFPSNWIDKRRLGNFVLLGLSSNIDVQHWNIRDKVQFLIKNSSISMMQVNELDPFLEKAENYADEYCQVRKKRYYSLVGKKLMDARETSLIKFALNRWNFPMEKMKKFSHVDSIEAGRLGKNENYFLKEEKLKD